VHYEVNYLRYYGQVYVACQGPLISYGLSVRSTFVNYRTLLCNGLPVAQQRTVFSGANSLCAGRPGAVQGMGTFGYSFPQRADHQNADNENLAPLTTLISAGVVVRPQLFRHRGASGAPQ